MTARMMMQSLIDKKAEVIHMVGRKNSELCVLKIDNALGLVLLLPDGTMVPGQVQTKILGEVRDIYDFVQVNTELYICGFNKNNVGLRNCYIKDRNSPKNRGPMNGTMLQVALPNGDPIRGEKGFSLMANDGEAVRCIVNLIIGDVVDHDGNSILVEKIT